MSTAYPGHSEETINMKSSKTTVSQVIDVAYPIVIRKYNKRMGVVDVSDQYMSYHNMLRRTGRCPTTIS